MSVNLGRFREHAEAKYHNENVTLALNFVMSLEDPRKNVDYDPKKQERYDKNVHVLKRIIQAVALCAQQGLALRGHKEAESGNSVLRHSLIIIKMSYPSQIQTRNMLWGWQKRAASRDTKHTKITISFTDSLSQHLSQYVVQLFIKNITWS